MALRMPRTRASIWADVLGLAGSNSRLIGRYLAFMAVAGVIACYGVVDRDTMRSLLYEGEPLSDLVPSTFIARREALQRVQGIGLEIVGPALVPTALAGHRPIYAHRRRKTAVLISQNPGWEGADPRSRRP